MSNIKPQYDIDQGLLNARYALFAEYYKLPHNEYLRDYFEPFVRVCIYEGAPITGRNSVIPVDPICVATLIKSSRVYNSKI
jgi:hypothetical protein